MRPGARKGSRAVQAAVQAALLLEPHSPAGVMVVEVRGRTRCNVAALVYGERQQNSGKDSRDSGPRSIIYLNK